MQYKILSLDGGGIRGLLTAIWLDRLEKKLGKPLNNYFDLVAGTSTGSLLACAVSLGIPTKNIIALYKEKGHEIFPSIASRLWSRVQRVVTQGPSAPKYDGKGLEKELRSVFKNKGKDITFGSLQIKPTIVVSYDVLNRQAMIFKNTKPEHSNLPVYQICKGSCSAPTFFPAHIMRMDNAEVPLIDGGVVANNPTACAIAEAIKINKSSNKNISTDDFLVASFGTGELTRPISIKESQEWGAIEWAIPVIDVLFDGSTDAVNYISSQILDENNYFRFQCRLDDAYDDMDNADPVNINALIAVAQNYLSSQGGDKMITQLTNKLKVQTH